MTRSGTWIVALAIVSAAAAQLARSGPPGPDSIDDLLEAGRGREALAACEAVAVDPGARDLARFLHQYGLAQRGAGRDRDASVSFARCAVHFPNTVHAVASLIELAVIERVVYNDPATAERLLQRAVVRANAMDRPDLAARARERGGGDRP